ncbi:hypothetical protein GPL15_10700 [Clostridium sp. MCC353]|uniref:NlpC/P60 family protein n=1 Tax=Clostridium sp. MCC353 TaxID=2592646 RepID=UPI001C03098E|nr:NlpC/P60 family protein [Clostridium sp. MCC353]MBT9776973.1 hypothetical protein [Clostridium sp. MCC353]
MDDGKKKQIISVLFMLAAGIGTAVTADHMAAPSEAFKPAIGTTTATPSSALSASPNDAAYEESSSQKAGLSYKSDLSYTGTEPETEEDDERQISAAALNQAFLMQPGIDGSDISAAEIILTELADRDSQWFNNLYHIIDKTPQQLAAELGSGTEKFMGKYNPEDPLHMMEDSSTWMVNSWENIKVEACDGDGNPINIYSNVKEIMSLASVFCYYNGIDNIELFREYAGLLWEESHSYTLGMSDVYYCEGCQEIAEGIPGYDSAAASGSGVQIPEEILAVEGPGRDALIAEYMERIANEECKQDEAAKDISADGIDTEEIGIEQSSKNSSVGERDIEQASEGQQTAEEAVNEQAPPDKEHINDTGEKTPVVKNLVCPGHVDLQLTLTIKGIEEENGLFQLNPNLTQLNHDDGNDLVIMSSAWKGWDLYNKVYAKYINRQDWEASYGLNVSLEAAMGMPLSGAEIRIYMNMLPEDTSKERKQVIKTALQSVGKIPYYWGGKPSQAGYEGNSFGSNVPPDEHGRVLKGLDCSGWINWVYWTATGQPLPYQGTEGLSKIGRGIVPEELKPGDIMVRLGANAHVVMFLAWSDTGEMIVIHESSDQNGGNVMISAKHPDWPYFRALLD